VTYLDNEPLARVRVRPVFETNSPFALLQHLTTTRWSTVLPHTYLAVMGELKGLRSLRLVDPDVTHQVGLVVAEREPLQPLARALRAVAALPDVRLKLEGDIGVDR
jgi:DNA-binding transcriptional LysR family regulator